MMRTMNCRFYFLLRLKMLSRSNPMDQIVGCGQKPKPALSYQASSLLKSNELLTCHADSTPAVK